MTEPRDRLIVAAIDFGTTYSSWAFSFKHSYDINPAKIETKYWPGGETMSMKAPTTVLIHPDGQTLHSFGIEAEDKYAELLDDDIHADWFFFRRFKMMLFTDQGLARDLMLNDASGKRLSALAVFGLSIRFLKDDLMKTCRIRVSGLEETDVHWVLTVPAIWTDAAKQFMREAAEWAGIAHNRLSIALESECASILCHHVPLVMGSDVDSVEAFSAGSKYMIVDAGGGTVDITVHEVIETGQLRELCRASGGAWGGTRVDAAFVAFLEELFGQSVIEMFNDKEMEDKFRLLRDFETKKRTVTNRTSQQVTFQLPLSLCEIYKKEHGRSLADDIPSSKFGNDLKLNKDKLKISSNIIRDFFNESIDGTISAVSNILKEPNALGVTTLVLVGGLSESSIYRDAVRQRFPQLAVIVPQDASLAVLKGAVIYGHDPLMVCERVIRYTYGFEIAHVFVYTCSHPVGRRENDRNGDIICHDLFLEHVKMGTQVKVGTKQNASKCCPLYDDQDSLRIDIYASTTKTPQLVTEPGCMKIGTLTGNIINKGKNKTFLVSMTFGGTEIDVVLEEESTGAVTKATVNFLG